MDIVHPWTLDDQGRSLVPITTFSIAMIQRQSGGQLARFAEGIAALRALKPGDRVLVAEACNHNRITDHCNDIGMVQVRTGWSCVGCCAMVVFAVACARCTPPHTTRWPLTLLCRCHCIWRRSLLASLQQSGPAWRWSMPLGASGPTWMRAPLAPTSWSSTAAAA